MFTDEAMVLEGKVVLHMRHIGRGMGEVARAEMDRNKDLVAEHYIRSVDAVHRITHTSFMPSEKLLLRGLFRCTVRVFHLEPGSIVVGTIVGHFAEGIVLGAADGAVRVLVQMEGEGGVPRHVYNDGQWVRKADGEGLPVRGDLRCRVVEVVHRSRELVKCFAVPV